MFLNIVIAFYFILLYNVLDALALFARKHRYGICLYTVSPRHTLYLLGSLPGWKVRRRYKETDIIQKRTRNKFII